MLVTCSYSCATFYLLFYSSVKLSISTLTFLIFDKLMRDFQSNIDRFGEHDEQKLSEVVRLYFSVPNDKLMS